MERLLTSLGKSAPSWNQAVLGRRVYLALLESGRETTEWFNRETLALRERGIRVEGAAGETSLSKHLKKANQSGIRFVVILGSEEFKKGKCTIKDMDKKA